MTSAPPVFLVMDAISAILTVGIAIYFLRLWTVTREGLHLLFALGLSLAGVSFATVSASAFDVGRAPEVWDHFRIAGQVGGVLVIVFAYASARDAGRAKPLQVVGFAAAALSFLFAAFYFIIPPYFVFSNPGEFIVAHAVMGACWIICAIFAIGGPHFEGRERLLVPGAFVAFAFSKYSWLLIDISGDELLIPFVYPWRFVGILLMILAIVLPPVRKEGSDAGPA